VLQHDPDAEVREAVRSRQALVLAFDGVAHG